MGANACKYGQVTGALRISRGVARCTQVSPMNSKLLQDGLDMTLYGLGAVMAFLLVLVFATIIMSALVRRLFPDPEPLEPAERGLAVASQAPGRRVRRGDTAALPRH